MRIWTTIVVWAAIAVLAPAAGATGFTPPVKLTGAAGGEPSIAADPLGDVYVSGPQGIPSGANGTAGVGFWASHDDGTSFPSAQIIGSDSGGGDSDVLVAPDNAVYVADLEASAAQICKSTDRGATFFGIGPTPDPNHCTTTNGGQAGPSDDREWLTAAPDGTLYLTYHEFVSAQPVAFRSDNGGADDFGHACGSLVTDPAIEANVPTDITGGTLVSKPITDKSGTLYVLFTTTTQQENAQAAAQGAPSGTFSQLYLAVSHDKCQNFTDYTVFDGENLYGENTVQFGDIFNDIAIDGAGNLYAIGAGYIGHTPFAKAANIYLFHSSDQGRHWSSFIQIGTSNAAHMLPAATGGPGAGDLSIGYFRTVNGVTDPNNTSGKWTYSTAQSTNANSPYSDFTYSDVAPGVVFHNGDICNAGILCGTTPNGPSDRSLLDFTAAAIDRHGCPIYTFAGNPTGAPGKNDSTNTFNYVTRQTTDCFTSSTSSSTTTNPSSGGSHPRPVHRGCPEATGRLSPRTLGPVRLGMTRARARRAFSHSSTHGRRNVDYFCLAPVGIRVGYAPPSILRHMSRATQRRYAGRVVLALTSNPFYVLKGVRPGARLRAVARRLRIGRGFRIGANTWYLTAASGPSRGIVKVRDGVIQEIGIIDWALTARRTAAGRLLRSFF